MVAELREGIKILERRNADLIDMSAATVRFHKKDPLKIKGSVMG